MREGIMLKFNIYLVFMMVAILIMACDPDPSAEGDRDDYVQDEGIEQGMQDFWIEQRGNFIEGAEFQIEELEGNLELKEDRKRANELNIELDNLRERLNELEQEGEQEWEDTRDEIANALIDIRREIDDME